jgi:hypothetical protein
MMSEKGTCFSDGPCGDVTCYRGKIGGWNYQYKDGPCESATCQWPKDLLPRPHFTDYPPHVIKVN